MFGLFEKKDLENDSFNNMLITALAESVRKNGNLPTEAQIFKAWHSPNSLDTSHSAV